jgi:hypothetical protein
MTSTSPIVTADLSDFGHRELKMAATLLAALSETHANLGDGITLYLNTHSGFVFLSDEDYNVAMMNGSELEAFYSCPECGHEGFANEMLHGEDDAECRRYLRDLGISADESDGAA